MRQVALTQRSGDFLVGSDAGRAAERLAVLSLISRLRDQWSVRGAKNAATAHARARRPDGGLSSCRAEGAPGLPWLPLAGRLRRWIPGLYLG